MSDHTAPIATEPNIEAITLVLDPALHDLPEESLLNSVLNALATSLQNLSNFSAHAWTVQNVIDSSLPTFNLTPIPGQRVAMREAWALSRALRSQPEIREARLSVALM